MNEMKELSGERRLVFYHGSEVAMRGCKKRRPRSVCSFPVLLCLLFCVYACGEGLGFFSTS